MRRFFPKILEFCSRQISSNKPVFPLLLVLKQNLFRLAPQIRGLERPRGAS